MHLTGKNYKPENSCETKKNILNFEKIKYKLSKMELFLIDDKKENIEMLDKLILCNSKQALPKNIYDSDSCPICKCDFDDSDELSKTYMPCGHTYCPSCLISSLKIKNSCSICRKIAKFNRISIPRLFPGKIRYLLKLIKKLNEKYDDKNILIYVNTLTTAKEIIAHINSEMNSSTGKKCMMIKQRSSDQSSAILVAPVNSGYICQNIKNIKNVIMLTSVDDYSLKPESFGYDFFCANEKVNVWLFEPDL
jgi:hypothetical protein